MRNWSADATKLFKGKTIARIGYLNNMEQEAMGWSATPFIEFTDGHSIIASSDDEGNSGGALINSRGELVGINTSEFHTDDRHVTYGISFAIPYRLASYVMQSIIQNGRVIRGSLGKLRI